MTKTRSIAAALLIALTPAVVSVPCYAQSTDDATTQEVKARFHEGVDLFDAGQFEAARAKFKQAYALKPLPDILYNLAQSSLKSGHPADAEREFQKFLREGRNIDATQHDVATKGLAEAHGKNAHIEVSAPPGTDVYVDSDHIGTTPFPDTLPVDPGAHVVKFQAPDGTGQTLSVSVFANQTQPARFGSYTAPTPTTSPATSPDSTPPASASSTRPSDGPEPASSASTTPASTAVPSADKGSHPNLLAPPKNLTPVFVLGGIGVAGIATGVVMLIIKGTAQSNADSVTAQIKHYGGTSCDSPVPSLFQRACSALSDDVNAVNTDATVGNIAVGVGIAAIVGAGLYWLFAAKDDSSTGTGMLTTHPVIAPMLGRGSSGLSLSGAF